MYNSVVPIWKAALFACEESTAAILIGRVVHGILNPLSRNTVSTLLREQLDVLSLGYFSLHEQREVARSPDASGNTQDAVRAEWKLCLIGALAERERKCAGCGQAEWKVCS